MTYLAEDHIGGRSQGSCDSMQADLGTRDCNHYLNTLRVYAESLREHQPQAGALKYRSPLKERNQEEILMLTPQATGEKAGTAPGFLADVFCGT